mmetsp:Transcript_73308/g.127249  ORF Transcript_73308/g.127249 Transcript_73308/m.127249 type:complete len:329 (-) Transcript_73308:45-1031(-)
MFKRKSKRSTNQKRGEPQYGNFMHIEPALTHQATTTGAARRISRSDLDKSNRGHIAESTRMFANLLTKHIQIYAEADVPKKRPDEKDASDDFKAIFSNSSTGSALSQGRSGRRHTQFKHKHSKFRQKDVSSDAADEDPNSTVGRSAESPKASRDRSDESGHLLPGSSHCGELLQDRHTDGHTTEAAEGTPFAAKLSVSSNKLAVPLTVPRRPSREKGTSSHTSSVSFTPDTGTPGEGEHKKPKDWQKEPHHGFTANVLSKMGWLRRRGRAPYYPGGAGFITGESCLGALTKIEKDARFHNSFGGSPQNSATFVDGTFTFQVKEELDWS